MHNRPKTLIGKSARPTRKEVSHDEILNALNSFHQKGGFIQHLPPQRTLTSRLAGARWNSPYETLFDR